jgi:hypothetical protein
MESQTQTPLSIFEGVYYHRPSNLLHVGFFCAVGVLLEADRSFWLTVSPLGRLTWAEGMSTMNLFKNN